MSTLRILSRSASTVGASLRLRPRLLSCLNNSPAGLAPTLVHGSAKPPLSTFVGAESRFFSSSHSSSEEKHSKVSRATMTGSTAVATRGFSSTADNPLANIDYRIASPAQHEDVVKLLYGNFFTDEPMSKILNLTDGVKRDPVLDEFVYAGLNENLTIVAIDSLTGQLLGACINVIAVKSEKEETLDDYVEKYKDSTFRHIMHVLYNVNHDAGDIYGEMESNVLFDIKMITTDKHNRKGGLATDLLGRSFELAKCLGFKGVKTEATGLYSRKAFTRLGFDVKAECVYDEFVSMDGDKVFAAAKEPHRCTTLMTKKI